MGRPPRIDFPLAIHHAMNRGVRGVNIFTNDKERTKFLKLLKRYRKEYGMTVFAYALMPNHFHLVLQSLDGRISSFMNALQSKYAGWFNQQHPDQGGGALFNHPFHSELVQEGLYLLAVIRYVLTNPHRSGFADETETFHSWTSMSEWKDRDAKARITDFSSLFSYLDDVTPENFVSYVRDDPHLVSEEKTELSRYVRDIPFLGDDQFLEELLEEENKTVRSREFSGPVPPREIFASVINHTGFSSKQELIESTRDQTHSLERYSSFYLLRVRSHLSLRKIATIFGLSDAAVSKGISKFRDRDWGSVKELLMEWGIEQGNQK